ncbi:MULTISPECIES: hypothetical protein [Massilia]|uniref:Flagellin n=2 Tax=Massilia TaxID=149698 RepID=A0ABY4A020_9BURK|nr:MULTISPECIES: hypothetical protein [Massilia]NHZ40018.1 hypothetical protein [Massilia aquatica]UOD27525.1 hypothetical protein INH39_18585 [Massilia violaceinigra]
MEAIRPTNSTASATSGPAGAHATSGAGVRSEAAPGAAQARPPQLNPAQPVPGSAPPLRRGLARVDHQLQGDVASAQQALDFLEQVAGQLQALKGEISAKLSSRRGDSGAIEAHLRQLGATMDKRRQSSGGSVDARLNFSSPAPASQRFRIKGLNLDMLTAGAGQTLSFSVGSNTQPLTVAVDPTLTRDEIVVRFDRALAPANMRVSADGSGALVFSTPENAWPMVRDSLSIQGVGRVAVEADTDVVAPQQWRANDSDALRQSLHEVVQALSQVQRSQDAASQALSAAASRASANQPPAADIEVMAQDFADTASTPNYESLLAITSALVGISRERVLALLGLH